MSVWQAVLLGLLQGVTEFLPVSSSGHLVIVPFLLGWPDPGLALDTLLHLGTLLAIVVYFWSELWRLFRAALQSLRRHSLADPDARVAWGIVVATIPAAVLGFLFEDVVEQLFGAPKAAAAFLLGTAVLLILSEITSTRQRPITSLSWLDAVLIGLAQALAIAPGLSRSGSTIAAGLFAGFRREDAARFSFLLAIPIILGSGLYQSAKLVLGGWAGASVGVVLAGMATAAVAGYLAISALLALVRRRSLYGFAAYCAVLGAVVLTGVLK
ncbi:MAG: undecaprenyl-diphosphatase UppP [Anaerolineae bacterium]|nr:undecaprenyl-diphosphatase UppP [Anaerolineae bacterium]